VFCATVRLRSWSVVIACCILIQNEQLEQVDMFPYFGSMITEDGECMMEFCTRLNGVGDWGISAENLYSSLTDFNKDTTNESASVACSNIRLDAFEMKRLCSALATGYEACCIKGMSLLQPSSSSETYGCDVRCRNLLMMRNEMLVRRLIMNQTVISTMRVLMRSSRRLIPRRMPATNVEVVMTPACHWTLPMMAINLVHVVLPHLQAIDISLNTHLLSQRDRQLMPRQN